MDRIDEELLNTINEEQGVSIELVDKTYDVYNKLISVIANNKALNDYREKHITDEKFSYSNKKFI